MNKLTTNLLKVCLVLLLILIGHGSSTAQTRRVELIDGSIGFSFVPPSGLAAMSRESMASVYDQSAIPPKFAFSDKDKKVFVSISAYGQNANEDELVRMKKSMETHAEKTYQKLSWLERDWVTINGHKWFRLKFRVVGGTHDVVNDFYVTDWAGSYVLFNFNAESVKYDAFKSELEASARTIMLTLVAVPPIRTTIPKNRENSQPSLWSSKVNRATSQRSWRQNLAQGEASVASETLGWRLFENEARFSGRKVLSPAKAGF
ncbi:MAG TPA: hypothetical protein VE863_13930 [Pyrinomonadaceae bacterium]|jgi:hypothetical protein|nr:hypothetical protein [Pyrinomonadaceae bacterium]